MTKLLEEALAQVRDLPAETQDLAAEALFMVMQHVSNADHYRLTEEQIQGVQHAMGQADRGEFASGREIREIFGRAI